MDHFAWKRGFHAAFTLNFFIALPYPITQGADILVVPVDGSHWVNMRILIEELKCIEHNITVLYSPGSLYIKERPDLYQSIAVELQGFVDRNMSKDILQNLVQKTREALKFDWTLWGSVKFQYEMMSFVHAFHSWALQLNFAIYESKDLLKQFENAHFDLMLTDPALPTGPMLAYYLKLPLVYNVRWLSNGEAHFLFAPSPLSYIPTPGSRLTDEMSLLQRTKNVIFSLFQLSNFKFLTEPMYKELCQRYLGPDTDIETVLLRADVLLMRVDFIFEFPRPTVPSIVYIGGFQCKAPKPLEAEFEELVQSSGEHGIIVMSVGTVINSLPMHIALPVAEAFAQVPQKVIWKHNGKIPPNIGNNTLLAKWIPQNDLLGHPKTRTQV